MSQTETTNIQVDITNGDTFDTIRLIIDVSQELSSATVELKKTKYCISWMDYALSSMYLVPHGEATQTVAGVRRLNDRNENYLLFNAEHLSKRCQYSMGDLDSRIIDGQPVKLDVYGRQVDPESDIFQANYHRMVNFPSKLLCEANREVGEIMQRHSLFKED